MSIDHLYIPNKTSDFKPIYNLLALQITYTENRLLFEV